jgi:RNA polymerase sigma-70 factor (ECF subfamily)
MMERASFPAPEDWEVLRCRLVSKVQYHLGSYCPDLEDLVQETLARFQRAVNADAVRKPESTSAFLSGICNNVLSEYCRGVWREVPFDADLHPHRFECRIAQELENRDAIAIGLHQLRVRDRVILTKFYLQEMGKDEICRRLHISDAQFRVVLFRAKTRLRAAMSESRNQTV